MLKSGTRPKVGEVVMYLIIIRRLYIILVFTFCGNKLSFFISAPQISILKQNGAELELFTLYYTALLERKKHLDPVLQL